MPKSWLEHLHIFQVHGHHRELECLFAQVAIMMWHTKIAASLLLLSSWALASPTGIEEKRDVVLQMRDGEHWVTTWANMPQLVESNNMPPSPFVSI